MIINYEMKAIELTKAEEKEARKYGSQMYDALKTARADNPDFRIVVKKTSKRNSAFKGLTYSYMESYLMGKSKELLEQFQMLTQKDEEDCEVASYLEVKEWFLKVCPEIQERRDARAAEIQKILKRAA